MKAIALLNRTVLATLLVSASVAAFANGGGPRGSGPYPYPGTAPMTASAATSSTNTATTALVANTNSTQAALDDYAPGKTRAQVRAELLQAEEAGLVPVRKNDYPPSAGTVARNQVRFQQIEQAWQSNGAMAMAEK